MNKIILLIVFASSCAIPSYAQTNKVVDGSQFYNLPPKSVECTLVTCPEIYADFKGVWSGEFQSYDRTINAFRPFQNKVIYEGTCYKDVKTGDLFIVGIKIDVYPEFQGLPSKVDTSLMITGLSGDNSTPFLRTIDKENGLTNYTKVFEDRSSQMSIWEYSMDKKENQPEMKFRIIDFRNLSNLTQNERCVYISLKVGPQEQPYWEGLVVKGSHSKSVE